MGSTILDVVALSGYSKATVSRAFAKPESVRPSTRDKIFAAAKALDYTPNAIAQAMVLKRTNNIGFVLFEKQYPVILNPFYAPIVDAVLESCNRFDLSLLIMSSADMRLPNGDIYVKQQLDGVIAAGQVSRELIDTFCRQQTPVVLLNNRLDDAPDLPSVTANDYSGAHAATDHLIERGHQRIALIQGAFTPRVLSNRKSAYEDALKVHGLSVNPDLVATISDTYEAAIECVRGMLERTPKAAWPTAFFCTNDTIAVGVIKALLRSGYRVPQDFAVVGFDDSALAATIEPELTTVHVNQHEMGEKAVDLLKTLMDGRQPEQQHIVTDTWLVKRRSVE